jgi:hypothetical protein
MSLTDKQINRAWRLAVDAHRGSNWSHIVELKYSVIGATVTWVPSPGDAYICCRTIYKSESSSHAADCVLEYWINIQSGEYHTSEFRRADYYGHALREYGNRELDREIANIAKPAERKKVARTVRIPKTDIWYKAGLKYIVDGHLINPRDWTQGPHLWHARELFRLKSENGKYTPLSKAVWSGIYQEFNEKIISNIRLQFPHAGENDCSMISYTQSPQHGYANRQTVTKPGKYFAQFTDDQKVIKRLSEAHQNGYLPNNYELHFAVNTGEHEDAIAEIYEDSDCGSCMSGDPSEFYCEPFAPVDAYGPEFACAYITDKHGQPRARAIVCPDRKQYWRVYGGQSQYSDGLTAALNDAGYVRNSSYAAGLKMFRLPVKGTFAFPYLDGDPYRIYDDGEWLYLGDPQNGKAHKVYDGDTGRTGGTCGDVISCRSCGDYVSGETVEDFRGNEYCESCADECLDYSERDSHYIHTDESIFSEHSDSYIQCDYAVSCDAGECDGETLHVHDATELHDGTYCASSDPDLVELVGGSHAMRDDAIELPDGKFALPDQCEEIENFGFVLTGIFWHGVNVIDCKETDLYKMFFKGDVYGSQRFRFSDISDKPQKGYLTFDAMAALATQGDPDLTFYLKGQYAERPLLWRDLTQLQNEAI